MPPYALGDHAYFAYVAVDDIDRLYEAVVAQNATVTKALRDEPWGMREFGVQTVDGHRIMFGGAGDRSDQGSAQHSTMRPGQ